MSFRLWMVAVGTLFALSLPAHAAAVHGICGTEIATLLRVHADREFSVRTIGAPPPPVFIDEEYVVTQGGSGVIMRTERPICCAKVSRTFAEGLVKRAAFTALTDALAAHHVEEQTSCAFVNDLSTPIGLMITGSYDLSLYGGGGLESSFRVEFVDPGGSTLPPCGEDVQPLIDAVRAFADAVEAVKANRICTP